MSDRTPEDEFGQIVSAVLDHWLGVTAPFDEWRTEIADIKERMAEAGLVIERRTEPSETSPTVLNYRPS